MATPAFIVISPRVNSFYFSDATNNGLNVLDQADYQNQILKWQWNSWYTEKSLINDPITLLFHIRNDNLVNATLDICDRFQNVVNPAVTTALNSAPCYKGSQLVSGNDWIDQLNPSTGVQLTSWLFSFQFSDFISYLTPDTPLSFYYIRLRLDTADGVRDYFSEPIYLRSDQHPNTQLYTCQYFASRAQNTNVVTTGWFNDYPASLDPYFPIFSTRCESYILPLDPKSVNIGYLAQNYEQQFITGQQVPMRTLKLGELSPGIPDYKLQMITEALLSDRFFIEGYWYKVWSQSASTSPSDMWKSKRDENRPLLRASTVITLGSLAQQAMVSPVPSGPTGMYDPSYYDPSYYTT